MVSDEATPTETVAVVQEALKHRISWCIPKPLSFNDNIIFLSWPSFPAAIETSQHRTHCYVPWPVGHVMSHDPSLISAVVHTLCDRGPTEMKTVQSMKHLSPATHSSVMIQVTPPPTEILYCSLCGIL